MFLSRIAKQIPSATLFAIISIGLLQNASAQNRCADIFRTTVRTEIKNDFVTTNTFTVNRSLNVYSQHFPFKDTTSIKDLVEQLPDGAIWVDMGAGEARALIEGLKANPRIAEGVAVAFKRPAKSLSDDQVSGRFRYLEGDYVENMARDGKLDNLKGRANLVTDVFGPLSYSEHLPPLLQTYIDILRPNGIAIFNVMSERNFDRPDSSQIRILSEPMKLNPVIRNGKTEQEGIVSWLRTIPGIEIVEVSDYLGTSGRYWEKSIAIKIRKLVKDVVIPNTLRTTNYVASSPPIRSFDILLDHARSNADQQNRPTLEDLPPLPKNPNAVFVYRVVLPSGVEPQATARAIDKFLESKQMTHLNAQLSVNQRDITIWSDPYNIAILRRQFSDPKWIWEGDFKGSVDPINPKIQDEIDRRISLYSDIAQDLYRTLFVRNFTTSDQGKKQFSFLTPSQLAQRKTVEELTALYPERVTGMMSGYLLKQGVNPERIWNSAHHNRTERIEMDKASQRFHSVESFLNAASALTESGLAKLSGGSERYYNALRTLTGASSKVKDGGLKNEILEAAAVAKLMSNGDIYQKARAEGIGMAMSAAFEGIRRSGTDPLLQEIGYGILNRLFEKIPALDLGKFTEIAVKSAESSVFFRESDGLVGPLQVGSERLAFLQSMLKSDFVSERPRLAAQSLLRRVIESQKDGQEIRLLPKIKVEEIYLKFASQVTTKPERGLYKFGFFINESYGMQSEVSPHIILADREALANGIELADWSNPAQAVARLTRLLPGSAVSTPAKPLLLGYSPKNGPRSLVFESRNLLVYYSKITGQIEILNSNQEPIVLRYFRDRDGSELPEIQIINGMIVVTDPKTETAKQYRLSDGELLRTFQPAKFGIQRIRDEHRSRQQ